MSKKIDRLLRIALLQNGKMERSLYEHELEEHIDYWYKEMQDDQDDFVFVVTENSGHVAMALIMPDKTLYINEAAREKLIEFWMNNYQINMQRLIPMMVKDLVDGFVAVNGVKIAARKPGK
jgi:hypothetical protein